MTCNLLDGNTVAYSKKNDASHRIRLLSEGVWWVSREHDLNSERWNPPVNVGLCRGLLLLFGRWTIKEKKELLHGIPYW